MSKKTNKPAEPAKKDSSPYVFQHNKINYSLTIRDLPWTDKQKELIELINDKGTRMVLLKGPAGSSKSIVATYCGLQALHNKKNSHILYSRPIMESADSGSKLGFLPGDIGSKIAPYQRVINEKLNELLPHAEIEQLNKENRIEFIEVNYIRGASLNAVYLTLDEAQNFTLKELITLITRIGKYSKIIVCADPDQSDLPNNKQGGFMTLWSLFNDKESEENGIFSFEFSEEDIMRSSFCKYIVKKTQLLKQLEKQTDVKKHKNIRPEEDEWAPGS